MNKKCLRNSKRNDIRTLHYIKAFPKEKLFIRYLQKSRYFNKGKEFGD